jgi:hypothetical protein
MPTFAELRARAEAAANAAKENANSRIADYRGDKKPAPPSSGPLSPNYKPPARRASVKPPLPTGPKPNRSYVRKSIDSVESAAGTSASAGVGVGARTVSPPLVDRPPPRQITPPPPEPRREEKEEEEEEEEKKVEEEERPPERRNIYTKIVPPAVIRRNTLPTRAPVVVPTLAPAPVVPYEIEHEEEKEEVNGIQVILQNKALFFEFMDEVCVTCTKFMRRRTDSS